MVISNCTFNFDSVSHCVNLFKHDWCMDEWMKNQMRIFAKTFLKRHCLQTMDVLQLTDNNVLKQKEISRNFHTFLLHVLITLNVNQIYHMLSIWLCLYWLKWKWMYINFHWQYNYFKWMAKQYGIANKKKSWQFETKTKKHIIYISYSHMCGK